MEIEEVKSKLGSPFNRDADFIWETLNELDLKKNAKILEIGTGRGTMAILLALHGYHVITGEPEGDNFADWKSAVEQAGASNMIKFQYLQGENLPFVNDSIDGIFMYGAFHHIEKKSETIKECIRVMKPNAVLCIFEFTPDGVERIRKHRPHHPDATDLREYTKNLPLKLTLKESKYENAFIYRK